MKKDKIKVIIKEVDKAPRTAVINNCLTNLQAKVAGYIETVTDYKVEGGILIVNDEGAINGMRPNAKIDGLTLFGTIIFAGQDGEEFTDYPVTLAELKKLRPELF